MIRNKNWLDWCRPRNFSGTFGICTPKFNAEMGTLPLKLSCPERPVDLISEPWANGSAHPGGAVAMQRSEGDRQKTMVKNFLPQN